MRSLVLRRAAQREFDAAADWYERQRPGLGREFIAEVDRAMAEIQAHGERYAIIHREFRTVFTRRFPYAIYYRVEPEQVVVLAVLHTSRDPAIWKRRR